MINDIALCFMVVIICFTITLVYSIKGRNSINRREEYEAETERNRTMIELTKLKSFTSSPGKK